MIQDRKFGFNALVATMPEIKTILLTINTAAFVLNNVYGTLQQNFEQVLTTRYPTLGYSKTNEDTNNLNVCHVEFWNEVPWFLNIHFLYSQYNPLTILATDEAKRKSVRNFKFHRSCIHIIVPRLSKLRQKFHRNWVSSSLHNFHQTGAHFILMGTIGEIKDALSEPGPLSLKYVTFISLDPNADLVFHLDHGSTLVQGIVTPFPPEPQAINGRLMKIDLFKLEPYVSIGESGQAVGGLTYQTSFEFCSHYNFSCEFRIDRTKLSQLPNGTWQGFFNDITDGDADAVVGFGPLVNRFPFMDFTTHLVNFYTKFYTTHLPTNMKWDALLHPFDTLVWTCIILSWLAATLVFYVSMVTSSHVYAVPSLGDALYKATIIPLSIFLDQAAETRSRSKLLTILLLFASIIIGACYNCNLISFLTLPDREYVPKTFEELADLRDSFHIMLAHNPGALASAFFAQTTNPRLVSIREVMSYETDWMQCILDSVLLPRTICIAVSFTAEMYAARNLSLNSAFSPLIESRTAALTAPVSAALRLNSRYLGLYNRFFGLVRDTGHCDKWTSESMNYVYKRSLPWMREQRRGNTMLVRTLEQVMENAESGTVKPFNMKTFVLSFIILGTGLLVGVICFLFESGLVERKFIMCFKMLRKREQQRHKHVLPRNST